MGKDHGDRVGADIGSAGREAIIGGRVRGDDPFLERHTLLGLGITSESGVSCPTFASLCAHAPSAATGAPARTDQQTWHTSAHLPNHARAIWAADLLVVYPDVQTLHVPFNQDRRRLLRST